MIENNGVNFTQLALFLRKELKNITLLKKQHYQIHIFFSNKLALFLHVHPILKRHSQIIKDIFVL